MLVHAGMSPLGQAIIAVALEAGAKVFASVMDEKEVQLLTERFPNVSCEHTLHLASELIRFGINKCIYQDVQILPWRKTFKF